MSEYVPFSERKHVPYDEEGREPSEFDAMTPEEHYRVQVDALGPVPMEYKLAVHDRHKNKTAKHVWSDNLTQLIAITVPDFACPSFVTSEMDCFGEAPALREYCQAIDKSKIESAKLNNERYKTEEEIREAKENSWWRDERSDMTERLDASLRGEQVTWASMGCSKLIPDMNPTCHARALVEEEETEFVHYNVWDWIYTFRTEKTHIEVVWLSYIPQRHIFKDRPFSFDSPDSPSYKNGMANAVLSTDPMPDTRFIRAIRVTMKEPSPCYARDGALFRLSEGEEQGSTKSFSTRLFLIDKRFAGYDEFCEDIAQFDARDINYSCVFGAILGDG